jgi:general L-amino acid transport system permease protein
MTTVAGTPSDRSVLPITERYTVLGWVRRNLFSDLFNSLLTLVALAFIVFIARLLLRWAFFSAEWGVIPANFNLIMRGQYPATEAWRLWLVIHLLGAVVGITWRLISGQFSGAARILIAIPFVLMLIPFFSMGTRLNLLLAAAAAGAGFYIAGHMPIQRRGRAAAYLLLAYLVVMLILLRGIGAEEGPMPPVQPILWGGLLLSLLLAFFGITLSFPLGVLLALGRQSKLPAIRVISVIYIEFIRGVPLISLLFMGQVMLQLFLPDGFPLVDRVLRALVAITLFSAAYTAENVRGGLQSISRGQYEAAQALGLSTYQSTMHIILPQALRAVIPVLVGQFISLFKDTTLVALVGIFDLLGIARTILANPDWLGTQQEVYAIIAVLFWIFSYSMSYASRRIEQRLGVGER